jgi:uncharacterized protein
VSRTQFGSIAPEPGQRTWGWVRVPGVEPAWELPACVVRGGADGATLVVTAGIHAAEYSGIAAAIQLAREVDPAGLRGTLIVVPLVNTPGFYEHSMYTNPRDGKNINRTFPGDPAGAPSQRVTYFLTSELIDGADAYVDLHGGDLIESLVPFAIYQRTGEAAVDGQSQALADVYGLDYVLAVPADAISGASYTAAARLRIPAIIAEAGQQGIFERVSVARHVNGLRNVMARLRMFDAPATSRAAPHRMTRFAWLRAGASATFHPTVTAGDVVQEGQMIGELRDLFGQTLQTLRAPAGGPVLFLVTALAVKEGDPLLGIGVV